MSIFIIFFLLLNMFWVGWVGYVLLQYFPGIQLTGRVVDCVCVCVVCYKMSLCFIDKIFFPGFSLIMSLNLDFHSFYLVEIQLCDSMLTRPPHFLFQLM